MTAALIAVIVVAALLTLTLSARPMVAAPGGLLALLAWMVAASASFPRHWQLTALCLVFAGTCGAYAVQSGRMVSADQRAADEQAKEAVR